MSHDRSDMRNDSAETRRSGYVTTTIALICNQCPQRKDTK